MLSINNLCVNEMFFFRNLRICVDKTDHTAEVAGLENPDGVSCYMNGVLQALASCPAFGDWVKRIITPPGVVARLDYSSRPARTELLRSINMVIRSKSVVSPSLSLL